MLLPARDSTPASRSARRRRGAVAGAFLAVVLSACGGCAGSDPSATTGTTAAAGGSTRSLVGEITVSAAASLTDAFTAIGKDFEAAHPGTKVTFTFDSSGTLAQQVLDGAPVDVFASADAKNVEKVADAGLATGAPTIFARNRLAIITKPGNPQGITRLADLSSVEGTVALCGLEVPCGAFAAQALEAAGVDLAESSVTRGQNAKATTAAVSEGDAVAGIVYVTDALSAGDSVSSVAIPEADNVVASYPAVALAGSAHGRLARAFVAYLTSSAGQRALHRAGFVPPR